MEKNAVAAIRHAKSQATAFKALGLSMKQLRADANDPMKLLNEIGDRLEGIHNASKRTAIAEIIFGRDGSKFLPLFDHGYLRLSAAETEASGASMSDKNIDAEQHVAEQWRGLSLQITRIKTKVSSAFFPIMSQLIGDLKVVEGKQDDDIQYHRY